MAESECVLSKPLIQQFTSDLEKIKAEAADGEYDLVEALCELRNIQIAHSLIPWEDPTEDVWAHHLVDFANAIFDFVARLETALEKATGISLSDLHEGAAAFESSAGQFWRALTSMKPRS